MKRKQSNIPREFLALRENWQKEAGNRGKEMEVSFTDVMEEIFQTPGFQSYEVETNPKDFKKLYGSPKRWGLQPDASISNTKTGRTVYIEVKRQRPYGNAHERACKYFAPGIVSAAREQGNIRKDDFPFFLIFTNGLASDERYMSEISFWFKCPDNPKMENHFLLWNMNKDDLLIFFLECILPVID